MGLGDAADGADRINYFWAWGGLHRRLAISFTGQFLLCVRMHVCVWVTGVCQCVCVCVCILCSFVSVDFNVCKQVLPDTQLYSHDTQLSLIAETHMTNKIQRQPALRTLLLHGSAAAIFQWSNSYTERGTGGMEKEIATSTLFAETLKQNYTPEALTYLIVESPGMCTLVRGVSVLVYVYVCLCVCVCVHRLCVSYFFFMYTSIIHIYKTENLCIQYLLFISIHMCTCVYIHTYTHINLLGIAM